jgi:hypothetical protein
MVQIGQWKWPQSQDKNGAIFREYRYRTEGVKRSAASVFEGIVNSYVNRNSYVNHLGD